MIKRVKPIYVIRFLVIWLTLFGLGLNKHENYGLYNYQSELWADKSGYYMYLPAAHLYNFDAHAFPSEVDENTGQGFRLDSLSGKVVTKYSYGVALLEAPFYFTAHFITGFTSYPQDGFSLLYQKFINLAASFYATVALLLLFALLARKYDQRTALVSITLLVLGTNLLYYIIDESGMSHVYSFFVASVLLFWWHRHRKKQNWVAALVLGMAVGLLTVIRPTNALLLLFIPLTTYQSFVSWWPQVKSLLNLRFIIPLIVGGIIVWLPQMLYWRYLSGNWMYYSYENEGFHWLNPQIIPSLLAPFNGLFLYSPLYLVLLVYLVLSSIYRSRQSQIQLVLFVVIIYLFSSWWAWHFGCSFGGRSYIEYLAIFSLSVGAMVHKSFGLKSQRIKWGVFTFLSLCVLYSIKMTYSISECFFGGGVWDWDRYFEFWTYPLFTRK